MHNKTNNGMQRHLVEKNKNLMLKSLSICGNKQVTKTESGSHYVAEDYLLGDPDAPTTWDIRFVKTVDGKKVVKEAVLVELLKGLNSNRGSFVPKLNTLEPFVKSNLHRRATAVYKRFQALELAKSTGKAVKV